MNTKLQELERAALAAQNALARAREEDEAARKMEILRELVLAVKDAEAAIETAGPDITRTEVRDVQCVRHDQWAGPIDYINEKREVEVVIRSPQREACERYDLLRRRLIAHGKKYGLGSTVVDLFKLCGINTREQDEVEKEERALLAKLRAKYG